MSNFINKDFLLKSETAKLLFHEYAENMPIIDYHNHLNPALVADDKKFDTITQVWLGGDHYKWRLLRAMGIEEKFITGDATDREKFKKFAEILPYTINNPIFHWSQLELARYFGVNELLNSTNADYVFDKCNERLSSSEYSTCGLLKQMKVELLCTTDDPIDSLEYHKLVAQDNKKPKMYPTWRADKLLMTDNVEAWNGYIADLAAKSNINITDLNTLIDALEVCQINFTNAGCRIADIAIYKFYEADIDLEILNKLIIKLRNSESLTQVEYSSYYMSMLYVMCLLNHKQDWAQQLHIGAIRNNNKKLFKDLGPDTGGDSMSDFPVATGLSNLLGKLSEEERLSRTILYNLHPKDGDALCTMAYNFNYDSSKAKMQYGAAWWFLYDKTIRYNKQLWTT